MNGSILLKYKGRGMYFLAVMFFVWVKYYAKIQNVLLMGECVVDLFFVDLFFVDLFFVDLLNR